MLIKLTLFHQTTSRQYITRNTLDCDQSIITPQCSRIVFPHTY